MANNTFESLGALQQLETDQGDLKKQLAIIRISEPISDVVDAKFSPSKRGSDVSLSNLNDPTPASLEADLTHYKVLEPELFSKLRFSYVEQVTKEKFLRAIVGDPPLVVGHNENVELETQLAEVKAELKASKEEARLMIEEMEKMGRNLASRYKNVEVQMEQLSTLPDAIENLEGTIAALRAKQVAGMDTSDPRSSQNLPLPATLSLLAEREAELAALNRQIAACTVLERRKIEAVAQAREAQRKKQEGESDGLEEMGRWYRGAEETLKEMVGVEG
ncbi:cytochrome P450 [Penicillium atrosanguineum]|uniref:cytochrome P450 n=1 Tax=Penicillium atrosanguineum TaxID=1132637 RepID=UPI0023A489E2|nr:cytochrome P450 [Penicillium atrosanguineum]KAJ5296962.1 cytochrome P450 [Penicillium atrosanguineum]